MQIQNLVDFIQTDIVGAETPKISAESKLFDDGLIDSIAVLNLIGYIEKETGRRLADNELLFEYFATPNDIVSHYVKA